VNCYLTRIAVTSLFVYISVSVGLTEEIPKQMGLRIATDAMTDKASIQSTAQAQFNVDIQQLRQLR
jgi:hypothetical protein